MSDTNLLGVKPHARYTCPTCDAVIHSIALVDAFGEPDGWQFWGQKGKRAIKHSKTINGIEYVHFWHTLANGAKIQALAIVRSKA